MPADVATTVFDLPSGWNWIGYTPQISVPVNDALSNIPEGNATYLKSQSGYAEFYGEFGWFGTLETMDPFLGYQLNLAAATDFVYNDVTGGMFSSSHGYFDDRATNIYDLNIHKYEFNGTVTAAIYKDGERIDSDDYILAAFSGNECVGFTEELALPYQLANLADGNTVYP